MGCGCNQPTTCTDCCNNTDPCVTQPCGCEVELDAACVRYTGEALPCADIATGDTVETALQAIAEKLCQFSGSYVTVTVEAAGVNCANGGIQVDIFDSESDTLLSSSFVCNGVDGAEGANGTPGADGADGNYIVQTVEAAGVNCPCGGVKLEVLDGVTNAVLTTTYVCDNCVYGAMLAQNTPQDLLKVTPGLETSRLCDMTPRIITEVYDDDNAYDPLTGIWTCPSTGRYDLNFYVHLTIETGNGWYDAGSNNMVGAGLMSPTGCNHYAVDYITITKILKHLDITGSSLGMPITAGTQLCLKIVNLTTFDYVLKAGDIQRISIRRVG